MGGLKRVLIPGLPFIDCVPSTGLSTGHGAVKRQPWPCPHSSQSVNTCVTSGEALTSLGLYFLIYKIGMIIAPTSLGPCGIK